MRPPKKRLLIVDGYNVLNAWRSGMDARSLSDARDELAHRLANYAGYTGQKVVLVFDAWMSDRMQRTCEEQGPLTVVFTQKNETADHYIELATSDNVEQTVVLGRGARRVSSRELLREMDSVRREGAATATAQRRSRSTLMDRLPEDIRRRLDDMRRGE